jgi:hypothetical protein
VTAGLLVALLLAAGVAIFVAAPLVAPDAMLERRSRRLSDEDELLSARETALAALRELEDDRATGKVGIEDYDVAKASLTARYVAVVKRLDAVEAARTVGPRPVPGPGPDRSA